MKIFELTIKSDYLPNWTIVDGIRELIQNAMDAKTEFGGMMDVSHNPFTKVLRIENTNCTLPLEALLIGQTSKAGRTDMRGQFGEGLDFGVNVLERNGHSVKIRSGGEVWTFAIAKSKIGFDAKVLHCQIQDGRKEKNRVLIEVSGITSETWEEVKNRFLFLKPYDKVVAEGNGEILFDVSEKGRVYVKGIFVEHDEKLEYGYNLYEVSVDRDRKMIDRYNRNSWFLSIWNMAVVSEPVHIVKYYNLLEKNAAEMANSEYAYFSSAVADMIKTLFVTKYGPNAFPVANVDSAQKIGHYGKTGVVSPPGLCKALQHSMGLFADVLKELGNAVMCSYEIANLSVEEKEIFDWAMKTVNEVEGFLNETSNISVSIVDFGDENLLGLWELKIGEDANSYKISIARKGFADRFDLLATLIHEVAHIYGADGSKQHVAAIERIWREIYRNLAKPKSAVNYREVQVSACA